MRIKAIEGTYLAELVTETDIQIGSVLKEFAAEIVVRWNNAEDESNEH
jgi:hypothetical protein